MTQRADRITCPRCGANNFDTQAACWKCGAGLTAPMAASTAMPMNSSAASPYAMPAVQERPSGLSTAPYAPQYVAPYPSGGDSAMARRAAIALALTIPFIGLPVGWIFMMIEEPRRQAIGKVCAMWSLLGLVLHMFLMILGAQAMAGMVGELLPLVTKMMPGGGGQPNRTDLSP